CHPDHLSALTKWLNETGFRSDLTVKRLENEDLFEAKEQFQFSEDSILSMIDILPSNKNPFYSYLWKWLANIFDFRIVKVNEFKTAKDKVVTKEGLVKSDKTTMRKLKQNIQFSLGWDVEDEIQRTILELTKLQTSLLDLEKQISDLEITDKQLDHQIQICKDYKDHSFDFLQVEFLRAQLKDLETEENALLKKNPDYKKMKEDVIQLEKRKEEALLNKVSLDVKIKEAKKIIEYYEKSLPEKINQLETSETFSLLIKTFLTQEKIYAELAHLQKKIQDESSHVTFDLALQNKSLEIEVKLNRSLSAVTLDLNFFAKEYFDPNLPYVLTIDEGLNDFQLQWKKALQRLEETELPESKAKWQKFFDQILIDSVKDTINEVRSQIASVKQNISSINEVLKLTNYEELSDEKRYLKIHSENSKDERIRKFLKDITEVEKVLGPQIRLDKENQSQNVMGVLRTFVESLQSQPHDRAFITDVRNHFVFEVHSLRRLEGTQDLLVEIFVGSKKDAKSSAQTTHLAYTLLASCLSYRFHFHDPILGKDTPRLLILDEFGGKFDNEKPKEILKLFDKMGFQSVLVSPMSKGDLLAGSVSHMIFVFKVNAKQSKLQFVPIDSKQAYEKMIHEIQQRTARDTNAH
ncbi:MAG: SbcC/MukB-like Walker B domain-containing protein, partial [Pseudobdellovibrionaceae bacterium]